MQNGLPCPGPRGNLTTLTAAVLFLHPECQVLNHGGRRIYGNKPVDFFTDYSDEKFKRFIQYSIRISKGFRKKVGGSIIHSHAFDSKYKTEEVYEKSGLGLVKEHIRSLFWKESHETSNVIRERHVDLGAIFKQNEPLRFLQPIRNPMDCAISNLKNTGHMRAFGLTGRQRKLKQPGRSWMKYTVWGSLMNCIQDASSTILSMEYPEACLLTWRNFYSWNHMRPG